MLVVVFPFLFDVFNLGVVRGLRQRALWAPVPGAGSLGDAVSCGLLGTMQGEVAQCGVEDGVKVDGAIEVKL